jgi:hypothetical protein
MSIATTNRAVGIKGDIHSKIVPMVVITRSPQDELLLCHGPIASEVIARTVWDYLCQLMAEGNQPGVLCP